MKRKSNDDIETSHHEPVWPPAPNQIKPFNKTALNSRYITSSIIIDVVLGFLAGGITHVILCLFLFGGIHLFFPHHGGLGSKSDAFSDPFGIMIRGTALLVNFLFVVWCRNHDRGFALACTAMLSALLMSGVLSILNWASDIAV
jgi:hypothetical protein